MDEQEKDELEGELAELSRRIKDEKDEPEKAAMYFQRGNVYRELGRNGEAIRDYDQAIKLNPDYALAYYNSGHAKEEMGLPEEANKDFKKANQLDPRLFSQESAKDIEEKINKKVREVDEKVTKIGEDTTKVKDFQDILGELKEIYKNDTKEWRLNSFLMIIVTSSVFFFLFQESLSLNPSYSFLSGISIKLFLLVLTYFCLVIYRDSRKLYLEAENRLAMAKLLENIRRNENLEPEIKNLAYPQLFSAIIYKLTPNKSKGEDNKNNLASPTQLMEMISHVKK